MFHLGNQRIKKQKGKKSYLITFLFLLCNHSKKFRLGRHIDTILHYTDPRMFKNYMIKSLSFTIYRLFLLVTDRTERRSYHQETKPVERRMRQNLLYKV